MFIFMNPTARNISCSPDWKGIRAPWLGTKQVWKLFYKLGFISEKSYDLILKYKPQDWTEKFSFKMYSELNKKSAFVTNLAKCTQRNAKQLKNQVYMDYVDLMKQEILEINPKAVITFGNQVSSILLGEDVSVSKYIGNENEYLKIKNKNFSIYPTYYPVGQGSRNMEKAAKRIENIKPGNCN